MENVITGQVTQAKPLGLSRVTFIALLFFVEVLLFQWINGAFNNEYTVFEDEAAHYVSALLIENYLTNGEFEHPLNFAEDFYYHYPKVSIGHWPPMMYGILAVWFAIFGASRISALLFVAATTAALATCIYCIAKTYINKVSAIFAPMLFIAVPLIQTMSSVVMLELMVTLFTLIASIFLARFLSTAKSSDGIFFALFASAAILTRGTAWSIGLMPIMIMLIAWRFDMLKKPTLWVSGGLVLLLCLPWYLSMPSVDAGAFESGSLVSSNFTLDAISWFTVNIYAAIGLVLLTLTAIGIWAEIITPILIGEKMQLIWPTLLAIMLSIYIMHITVPAGFAIRYMTAIVPSIILFSFAGLDWLIHRVSLKHYAPALMGLFTAAYITMNIGLNIDDLDSEGYAAAYDLTTQNINSDNKSVLVASGVFGEGGVISRAAEVDTNREVYILRGSKLLVTEDWMGRNPVSKFNSAEEVSGVLASIPVDAVILDNTVSEDRDIEYNQQLSKILKHNTQNWRLLTTLPITKNGKVYEQGLSIYLSQDIQTEKTVNTDFIKELYQNNRIPSVDGES